MYIFTTRKQKTFVELFFLDNYTDSKLYLDLGADKIATAISEAIGKQEEAQEE